MSAEPRVRQVDVLVVGAGPAGLAAAARLAVAGAGRVEVLEREAYAGGVPRHCAHGGFGTWTRPLNGLEYARLLTEAALRAGAVVRTGATVLDWAADTGRPALEASGSAPEGGFAPHAGAGAADGGLGMPYAGPGADCAVSRPPGLLLTVVSPRGLETIAARAVVLATGSRERPRAARLVPGTRPAGVYTTGELQQAVHLFGQSIGTRAVVVGAQDVSYAAADTVRAAGADVVALVTEQPRAEARPARVHAARLRHRIPLLTDTTVTGLLGRGRLSGVGVRHRDGRTATLPCDTVVFTGDFVAADELARQAGIQLGATPYSSHPGVFAAGALLLPGRRAGEADRDGVEAAGAVLAWLAGGKWPTPS